CARAMFIKTRRFARDRRLGEALRLSRLERRSVYKRDLLFEDPGVTHCVQVVCDGVRKPEAVVRDCGPHALAARGQPPVLDVAFPELASRRAKEMAAGNRGISRRKGHNVLQLI